ncbi:hypothetical protein FJT64_012854 [Amphibalanus amphitrite]|uniref:Apple domain-containing protein n=1 Tax=Amphibalanus amphitrite TaxID=1232801 RepID=A0A6A4VEE5_AMPAM|nr:hypothetical protein FJT64_012854 [Amphibalanus amphitrite]
MLRFCWSLAALLAAVGLSAAVQFGLVTGRHPSFPLLEVPGSSRVLCAIRCLRDTSCVSWEVTGSGCSLYRGVTSDPTAATSSGPLWADLWIPDGYQMFGLVTGRHPSSPLLEVPGSSRVLCAIRCLRDTSCVSWEVTGSGCSLYRGVTSDPTAATSSGPLWADLWIPDGYQMVPGTSRAFRAHNERKIAGTSRLPAECAVDHRRAAPAFLENEDQPAMGRWRSWHPAVGR